MTEVWYVSYGSNMCGDRLACYLRGGRPPGATRTYRGARDRRLPRLDAAVELPGRVFFAHTSPTWGGGVAFYDHETAGPAPARAYRMTLGQFVDIAAQEMRREPSADDPLEKVIAGGLLMNGRYSAGPGRYETVIEVGHRDGLPMLTFTSPGGVGSMPANRPTQPYLAMLSQGLKESHGWDDARIQAYFAATVATESAPDRR